MLVQASLGGCGSGQTDAPSIVADSGPDAAPLDTGSEVAIGLDASRADTGASPPDTGSEAETSAPLDPSDRPGTFAAVGNHVRHIRSLDDGLTWIDDATDLPPSTSGDADGIRTVVWGHDTFIAFAAKVFTSPDGRAWTQVPKGDGQWLASMLYAEGQYVSSGGYGWLATTTTDLGAWVQHPPRADYTAAHHSRAALAHGKVAGADA
ncbi:MAG: hypothetical protein NVSMB47_02320 [Polyangiales bacterium]